MATLPVPRSPVESASLCMCVLNLFFGRGVRPGPRHPNPGLNQKVANVYPSACKPNICKHSLYLCCTQVHLNGSQRL